MATATVHAIRELVRTESLAASSRLGPAFFEEHVEVVVRYGRMLAARLGADPDVVELAAWLHDLAAIRDLASVPTHHLEGARVARELLAGRGCAPPVVDAVCRCIESHSAPVAVGAGTAEEVCVSNADVMAQIARPAYWLFYLYRLRRLELGAGREWLRTRVERSWTALTDEARQLVRDERAAALRLIGGDPFSIRHAEPGDYDPVIAVVDAWWGGRRMADMLPRLFFEHFRPTSFVAEAQGRVVGFLAGFLSQGRRGQAYVHFVGVDPPWRKAGVGRALYERFFDAARDLGCTEVRCVTSPVNAGSIAFHAAMGFEALPGDAERDGTPYATDYDGPGESRVRLRRRID